MIYEHGNIRSYLSAEYAAHSKTNPSYSLRAFARKLNIAPSTLSEVMSGKKRASREMAARLASALKLKSSETEYLCLMADHELAKSEKRKHEIYQKLMQANKHYDFVDLETESFQAIREWYHFPVLELLNLQKTNQDLSLVATKLGISTIQCRDAVQRLITLGLLQKTEAGYSKVSKTRLIVKSEAKNEALREFHNTMLERAKTYLKEQNPKQRFVGSETFRFDEKFLPEANEAFEECFDKLIALSQRSENAEHVFHMGIQFFALSKGDKK